MANYIGEQGLKVLEELRGYLKTKPTDKQNLTQLVQQVPGSRFFGFLKYQLLEKEADFAVQREELANLVNQQIEKMQNVKTGQNYFFVAEDADCLAYILNDLNAEKKDSGIVSRLIKSVPEFFKRLMQPGGIKRYLAILLILALVVFSILSLTLLHVGILTSLLVSAAVMFGLNKLSNMGQNSDDAHIDVFAGIKINHGDTPSEKSSNSTNEITSALDSPELSVDGQRKEAEAVIGGEGHRASNDQDNFQTDTFELSEAEDAAAEDAAAEDAAADNTTTRPSSHH